MKRPVALASFALLALMAVTAPAEAQRGWDNDFRYNGRFNTGGGINNTQAQLQARISAGIRSGRLSQREAAKLQGKLGQIATMEARLRATGGRLSFTERQRLNTRLANLSAEITRDLNDYDRRFAGRGRGGWR